MKSVRRGIIFPAGECLYESQPYHAYVRYSHQLRFRDVEETGILIAVDEILAEKRIRHIESFIASEPEACKLTSGANKVVS